MSTASLETPDDQRELAHRHGHLPGEPGLWLLIIGDMTVFLVLFLAYIYTRSQSPGTFDAAQATLSKGLGSLNTVFLLTSSLMVAVALRAIRAGSGRQAQLASAVAVVFGLAFMAVKVGEWWHHAHGDVAVGSGDFWMYYYVITGLHFGHLSLGLGALSFIFLQARRPDAGRDRIVVVESAGCFWHMVDLLWMVIFALLYLVR